MEGLLDDFVIVADKEDKERKNFRVNAGKTSICGTGLGLIQSSGDFPCTVCHTCCRKKNT